MAIEIKAFSGFSKRINSTKQPTGGTSVNAVLKAPTSVIKPTFKVTNFDLSWNYIQWGNRYFFVDDIIILTNDIAEYVCSIDVLATYKSTIGASSEYVVRSASASDGNIIDSAYPTKTAPTFHDHILTNIHSQYDINSGCYVIGVKNGAAQSGLAFYSVDPVRFAGIMRYLFSDAWLDATDITKALQKMLCNPMDYISCCYWYPFAITTGHSTTVKFGYWDTGVSCDMIYDTERIKSATDPITLNNHPQIARGNYLNGAPYSQILVDCFGFGRIPVDPNMFLNSRSCAIQIQVDLFTGVGELIVESSLGRVIKESSMVGVPVQLSQVTQDLIKPVIGVFEVGRDLAKKRVIGAANGIVDAVMESMPQVRTSGSMGSTIAYNKIPVLHQLFYNIVDEDNVTLGRPLCQVRTISSLSGYMECANVDIDSVGTEEEKRAIIDYMQGGFFYE